MGHFPTSFKSTALAMASHPVSQHHHHCKYIYRCKYIYIYLYIFCLSDDGWDILADLIDGRKPTRKDRSMYTEGFAPGHSVKHFFNLETRMRISLIQSRTSRRDENLWHLISGFETRPRKMSFQSQASRRDRDLLSSISDFETRTRIEIKTILARIWFVACAWTDIFQKKTFNFLIFLKIIHFRFSRQEREILSFNLMLRDKNENFFFFNLVLRDENEK